MRKYIYTIPVGFETYKEGNKEIFVKNRSCFTCHYCKVCAYDQTNYIHIIQCKHDEQWKNNKDMTDFGVRGVCPKWEEKLEGGVDIE